MISPILLTRDNYEERSRSLCNNLRVKNKLGFIDGITFEPLSASRDFAQWDRNRQFYVGGLDL